MDTFGGPTQKIQVCKVQGSRNVETAQTVGIIRPSGLRKFVHMIQLIRPYLLVSKSYPLNTIIQLLYAKNPKTLFFFTKFPLSLSSLSCSYSPSHLLHVLHVKRAIIYRFKCLPNPGLNFLNLEKYPGGSKLRCATYKFRFLWIRLKLKLFSRISKLFYSSPNLYQVKVGIIYA